MRQNLTELLSLNGELNVDLFGAELIRGAAVVGKLRSYLKVGTGINQETGFCFYDFVFIFRGTTTTTALPLPCFLQLHSTLW
jgi:hypothetical protein